MGLREHFPEFCEGFVRSNSLYSFVTIASLDPELSMNAWLSKLESSSWLDYVQSVLSTACFVAQCLDTQGSVKLLFKIINHNFSSIVLKQQLG